MRDKADNGIHFLEFPLLEGLPVVHAVFRRHGGISPLPFDSLNVSFGVGDEAAHVRENRIKIKRALGLPVLVSARQVHGDRVLAVEAMQPEDWEAEGYDALITNRSGVGLMIQQADCQAVLLADTKLRAIGVCHAGWRGSVANIIAKTIRAMQQHFAVEPRDLLAAVSPSLGPCCAEFVNYHKELPESFRAFRADGDKFDFWAISRKQLQEAGVPSGNIEIASICTVCNADFFSYRRQKITGRFASVIALQAPSSGDERGRKK